MTEIVPADRLAINSESGLDRNNRYSSGSQAAWRAFEGLLFMAFGILMLLFDLHWVLVLYGFLFLMAAVVLFNTAWGHYRRYRYEQKLKA